MSEKHEEFISGDDVELECIKKTAQINEGV